MRNLNNLIFLYLPSPLRAGKHGRLKPHTNNEFYEKNRKKRKGEFFECKTQYIYIEI